MKRLKISKMTLGLTRESALPPWCCRTEANRLSWYLDRGLCRRFVWTPPFPSFMVRMERMGRCRPFLNWRAFLLWGVAYWRLLCAWTKTALTSWCRLLEQCAATALNQLMAELDGWRYITAVSGWRSQEEQREIYLQSLLENGEEFTNQFVARPGHSEHQTGLAIDLGLKQPDIDFLRPYFPYKGICQTFRELSTDYGFIERYPAGQEAITGIAHEPWHFRYVGVPLLPTQFNHCL